MSLTIAAWRTIPDAFRDHAPIVCEQCGGSFPFDADRKLIGEYDEIVIPPVKPHVVRHRRFACRCQHCGADAKAAAPAVATTTPFGPRIHALAIYYKGSRRLPMSGCVSCSATRSGFASARAR